MMDREGVTRSPVISYTRLCALCKTILEQVESIGAESGFVLAIGRK